MKKILVIDRDGTLLYEPPETEFISSLAEMEILPCVVSSLKALFETGYELILVTNQDGLGTSKNPTENFDVVNAKLFQILASEGVSFSEMFVCPHFESDLCACRKPRTGLFTKYLAENTIDLQNSYVIGDRETDMELAKNLGIPGLKIQNAICPQKGQGNTWAEITHFILHAPRMATVVRKTKETSVKVTISLDGSGNSDISTGIPFFDHMLEQVARHGNIDLSLHAIGDLIVDSHHTIEDTALTLGEAFKKALGDKRGIARFGEAIFTPMDESQSTVVLDISGRPYCMFTGAFIRSEIGGFPTEMTKHFFESFTTALGITLHLTVTGENDHHKIESLFKGLGRALQKAMCKRGNLLPSTKGVL
ncbi:MAG: bifunctional histidinol-phosphatase/imidazoleglycerol-phosphate dehydratase HisB [Candidatus Peregrinibacteria bacterium]